MSNVLYVLVFFKLFVILIHSKSKKYLVETEDGEQMGRRKSYKYNVTPPSDDKFKCEMDDDCSKPGKLCEEIPGGPFPIEKCLCVNNKCCGNIGDGTCGNQDTTATPPSYDKFKCEKDDDCSKPGKLCEVIPGGPIPTEGCHCVNNKCCGDIGDGTCGNQVTPPSYDEFKCEKANDCTKPGKLCGGSIPDEPCLCFNNKCCDNAGDGTCAKQATPPSYDKFKCEKDDDCSKPGKLCEVIPGGPTPTEGCHCVNNKCCGDIGDGTCGNQVTPPSDDKFKCEKDDDCSKPGKLCEVIPGGPIPTEGCHCVNNKCCGDIGDGTCGNQGYCKHPHKNIDRLYKDGESFNYCCNKCGCDCNSNGDCGASCTEKGCSCTSCKKEEECDGYMGMSAMCYWNNKKGCISKTKGGSYYDRHGGNGKYKG